MIEKENLERDKLEPTAIRSKIYNIQLFHDFPQSSDWLQHIESVREQYDRRSKRLFRALSGDRPVCFLRLTGLSEHAFTYRSVYTEGDESIELTKTWVTDFVELIKNKFPRLPFILVCGTPAPVGSCDWEIKNYLPVYIELDKLWKSRVDDQTALVWLKIFTKLGFVEDVKNANSI